MATRYSLVPRKNPAKKDEPAKFYAQIQSGGSQDFKTLTRAISNQCTVTSADAKAVLDAFMQQMLLSLASGQIVRMNDLGSFRLSISSKGTATKEEFKATQITKARIIFTPCTDLKEMLASLSYEKSSLITDPDSKKPGGGDEGGGGVVNPT